MALLAQSPAKECHLLLQLAAFDLVGLGRNDDRGNAGLEYPVVHHDVLSGRLMPDIEQKENRAELGTGRKIALDHFAPLFLDLYIRPGIAISRQIHQVELFIDTIIIDRLCLTGL